MKREIECEIRNLNLAHAQLQSRILELTMARARLEMQVSAIEARLADALVESRGVDPTIPEICRVLGMRRGL